MSSNEHDTYKSEKDDSTNNDLDDKALLEEYQKNKINWLSMYIVLIEDLETEINKVLSKE